MTQTRGEDAGQPQRRTWTVRDAASNVTRLLCAGVYLDDAFRDRVIEVMTSDPDRYLAPSYGYDVMSVFRHARAYRDRRVATGIVIVACAVAVVLTVAVANTATPDLVVFLVAVWLSWVAMFFERLHVRSILTYCLRRPAAGGSGDPDVWTPPFSTIAARTSPTQDPAAGLVYYSGFKPFVGAGESVRSWAFPILLVDARPALTVLEDLAPRDAEVDVDSDGDGGGATGAEPTRRAAEFNASELLEYVEHRLGEVLNTAVGDDLRIQELDIVRRWYRTALAERRPRAPRRVDLNDLAQRQGQEEYGSPREYLCIHVGSWKQELVASVFLRFDIKGRTLYTEFHASVLKPVRADFHRVDLLPRRMTPGRVVGVGVEAVGHLVKAVVTAPFDVLFGVARYFRSGQLPLGDSAESNEPGSDGLKDYGARESIREFAASSRHHHFFQQIDAEKYIAIIERWIDEAVLDFLESKRIDTREFRSHRSNLVNLGIIQTGGHMNNEGVAVGTAASVISATASVVSATAASVVSALAPK